MKIWRSEENPSTRPGTGGIWSAVIPAKAGIHAATMALPLCTSPSGIELLGSNESNLPLDSRFRGNDCLHRPARKINFPQMTSLPSFGQDVVSDVEMKERDCSKFEERRGNVYENKGSAFHDPLQSGNVYENTGT